VAEKELKTFIMACREKSHFIEANGREMLRPATEEFFYNFRVKLCCSSTLVAGTQEFTGQFNFTGKTQK